LIRIEYTIDGKSWNHIVQDNTSLLEAKTFAEELNLADFAKEIKFLTVTDELTIQVRKN